jgi:hypothetical protein
MFTLGHTFRPWDGEQAIADGGSILKRYQALECSRAGSGRTRRYDHLEWPGHI